MKHTRIQFPRFQSETNPEQDITKRKVMNVASRNYMYKEEVRRVINPKTIVERKRAVNEKNRTGWWGEWHDSRKELVLGDVFRPIQGDELGKPVLFRYWLIHHAYQWDTQAMSGKSKEVVLEKLNPVQATFREVAALLINENKPEAIQMVVKDESDDWQEPKPMDEIDLQRDFCLQVIGRLSIVSLIDIQPTQHTFSK